MGEFNRIQTQLHQAKKKILLHFLNNLILHIISKVLLTLHRDISVQYEPTRYTISY